MGLGSTKNGFFSNLAGDKKDYRFRRCRLVSKFTIFFPKYLKKEKLT
jgi:hypothetical protein